MAGKPYRVKAYSFVNKKGKTVHVKSHMVNGIGGAARVVRGGGGIPKLRAPAPRVRGTAKTTVKLDSPLRAMLPSPGRVLGRISVKQGRQRLTQKGATRNMVNRQARKQVRKVLPGTTLVKARVNRRRRRR